MAFWSPSSITDINEGSTPNDGTGDSIRSAFLKVDENFSAVSSQLGSVNQDFLNANVSTQFNATSANIGNLVVANINSEPTIYGNINVGGHIIATEDGQFDLGSAEKPFRNLYYTTLVTDGVTQTSDAGLLSLHANILPGDVKDVGIFGNISHSYTSNTYAFFGYQKQSNNFVYKITNVDAILGNSVVYNGFYGNAQFGSMLLSNTTPATSNITGALIVAGGISSNNEIHAQGNIYSGGYRVISTADISTLGYSAFSGSDSLFIGNTVFTAVTPSTTTTTGAIVVLGGVGVVGNVTAGGLVGNYFGNVRTANQPFITGLGTLGNLSVAGTTTTSTLQATSIGTSGLTATSINTTTISTASLTGLSSLNVNTLTANVVNAATIGNTGATITGGVGTLTSLSVAGNATINNANVNSTLKVATIQAATIGNTGTVLTGTLSTSSQTNITSLGTLSSLTVTGNTAINNTLYGRDVYDNSNRVVSSAVGSPGDGNITINSNGSAYLTRTGPGVTTVGSATAVPIITTDAYGRITALTSAAVSSTLSVSGTSGTGTVSLVTQSLIFASTNGITATSSGQTVTINTPQDLRTTASPTLAGLTLPSITKSGTNGAGDIGQSNNTFATVYATTFSGVATTAKYADLAENYQADVKYAPGTVLVFGGDAEVTVTNAHGDERVAGAVSTDPAHLMNGGLKGATVVALALRGRVPCRVIGPVTKGDSLVTSTTPGCAVSAGRDRTYGQAVFAKSLDTDLTPGEKTITVVIL